MYSTYIKTDSKIYLIAKIYYIQFYEVQIENFKSPPFRYKNI